MQDAGKYQHILNEIEGVVESSKGWKACCPAHDDNVESLSITIDEVNQNLLFYCHAGCELKAIIDSLNLQFSDLFPDNSGKKRKKKKKQKTGNHEAFYNYTDEDGAMLYQSVRIRYDDGSKSFLQRRPKPDGKGWVFNMKGISKVPYNLSTIINAKPEELILIVEGEKDADFLNNSGFIATCNVGGAGKWLKSYNKHFKDRHIVIIPDNDEAGKKHADIVSRQLHDITKSIKVLELPDLKLKEDVSDWKSKEGSTPAALRKLIEDCSYWQFTTPPKPTGPIQSDDDPHRLAELYLDAKYKHDDKFTLRFWKESFYKWTGTCYIEQSATEVSADLNNFVRQEFVRINNERQAAASLSSSSPTTGKVTTTLINNVIAAIKSNVIIPDVVQEPAWLDGRDDDPYNYLSMKNVIVCIPELITNNDSDKETIPHTPDFFNMVAMDYEFKEDARCDQWINTIHTNLENDQERIDLIQEWFGYNLVHDTSFQKFLVIEGMGANGKSVVCAVLEAIIGDNNVSHVGLENFGQRFQLTETVGKLANISGDMGEIDKAAEGILKAFVSGDRMSFDRKNKAPIKSKPSARLTMAMNNRPRFSDKSDGLWRRMILIPFNRQVKDTERVYGMDSVEYWDKSGELPGIFIWSLLGLHRLRHNRKFTNPKICKDAAEDFRTEVSPARDFLLDNYEQKPSQILKTQDVYETYKKWCHENGYHALGSRTFGKEVFRTFIKTSKEKKGSRNDRFYIYMNLAMREDNLVHQFETASETKGRLFPGVPEDDYEGNF